MFTLEQAWIVIFQGLKFGVTIELMHNHAPFVIGVHCMAHRTNLIVRTLKGLNLVKKIEYVISSMYNYFIHNPKCHLEVIKLVKLLDCNGNKLLKNIKIQWILMFSRLKRVLNEYENSCCEDGSRCFNHQHCKSEPWVVIHDVETVLGLTYIFPLLEIMQGVSNFP